MKKLSILFAALTVCAMSYAADYVKVTSAPTDWSGEYLLVYEEAVNTAYVWTGADSASCYTTATIAEGKISGDDFITITIAPMEGGYSIMVNGGTNNGTYIGGASGSNKLYFNSTPTLNTLAFNKDTIKITSNTSVMRFNNAKNNLRFRYFKSASYSGQQAVQLYKKEVVSVPATGIAFNTPTLFLDKGTTAQLTAILTPADATTEVVWSSSDETIATVKDGLVTALAVGNANITASVTPTEGTTYKATCAVTVTAAVLVESVTIEPTTLTIEATKTDTLVATIAPANASNKNVSWTTSDASVATVKDGVVTGVAAGTADIIVTTENGAKTAVCKVTVTAISGMDYSVDLSTTEGYNTWKADNKSIGELSYVWTFDTKNKCAKASAYVNKTNNAAEAWLISPVLNLSEAEVATMTINHALNYLNGKECPLKIMGTKDGKNWEELAISAWPAGSSWTFEDATVDLTSVISATTQVALAYISTTTVAPTWEVKTVSIKGSKSIHATAVALNKTTSSIEQYKRDTLSATLTPAEASDAIVWTSADESIATVKNGVVTAIGMGTTDITATAGTVTATCVVTVTDAKPITIAEAVKIAQTVTKNNEIAAGGQYVIRGYVTELQGTPSDDMTKYGNYSVWLADSVNGGKVFEAYAVAPVDGKTIAAVGDYVEVIGDITKYYNSKSETTTYETAKGGSIKVLQDPTTAVENTTTKAVKTKKVIENGQLIIIDANGVRYNAVGVVIE